MRRFGLVVVLAALLLQQAASAQDAIRYYSSSGGTTVTAIANTNVSQTTTGTAEETLYTFTIPANTFPAYSGFYLEAWFVHANNTNGATQRIKVGGTGGATISLTASSAANEVSMVWGICRVTSASGVHCGGAQLKNTTVSSSSNVQALTFTNAIEVLVRSTTATGAGDITLINVNAVYFK